MQKPRYHFFVCNSFRMKGEPQGACHKKGAADLSEHLSQEILERGLDAQVSSCGCLKVCDRGPVMAVYPEAWWYGDLTPDKIDEILEALKDGGCVDEFLVT
jgi:(2Fe-2S) ferredoxin